MANNQRSERVTVNSIGQLWNKTIYQWFISGLGKINWILN